MPGLTDEAFPIEKHYKPTPTGTSILGYLFKRACTRFLIYRIDPSCGIEDSEFDWTLFEHPPQNKVCERNAS
jgi:hypothetical protein